MAEQTERAYQKQPTVFQNSKASLIGVGKKKNKGQRFIRNVGLGFKAPKEIKGTSAL
jgi:small subunit ribosomal protein S11e